jgi:hypothetical protein
MTDLYSRILGFLDRSRYFFFQVLGDNIDTIKKNTETLIDASMEVGLEINIEKTKYIAISLPECRSKSGYKNSKHRLYLCHSSNIWGRL